MVGLDFISCVSMLLGLRRVASSSKRSQVYQHYGFQANLAIPRMHRGYRVASGRNLSGHRTVFSKKSRYNRSCFRVLHLCANGLHRLSLLIKFEPTNRQGVAGGILYTAMGAWLRVPANAHMRPLTYFGVTPFSQESLAIARPSRS